MSDDAPPPGAGPDSVWASALSEGRFLIQRCDACGAAQWPPATVCRACGAAEPGMVAASGRGTVHATTTVRTREGAHNVSLIDLAEGVRLMSRVACEPVDGVRIGMAVQARVLAGPPAVLVFDPAPEDTR